MHRNRMIPEEKPMNKALMNRVNIRFEELVPLEGKADTLAGEIVRAISRIGYRFYNDGDQVGVGYGKQTCNPPARFLASATSTAIGDLIRALWQVTDEAAYQRLLDVVTEMTMDYIDEHPELREQSAPDMWDYQDEQEDRDDYDDEDEY